MYNSVCFRSCRFSEGKGLRVGKTNGGPCEAACSGQFSLPQRSQKSEKIDGGKGTLNLNDSGVTLLIKVEERLGKLDVPLGLTGCLGQLVFVERAQPVVKITRRGI